MCFMSNKIAHKKEEGNENKLNKCFEMENLMISPPTSFVWPFIAAKQECRGADV